MIVHKPGAPFRHGQLKRSPASGLAMEFQLEPVFEQRLHHGPEHRRLARRALSLCLYGVKVRRDPGRGFLDRRHLVRRKRPILTVRKDNVSSLEEGHQRDAVSGHPVGRRPNLS